MKLFIFKVISKRCHVFIIHRFLIKENIKKLRCVRSKLT